MIPGNRLALPTLHDVLWWTLAAAIAVLAAALVWAVLTPLAPLGAWHPSSARTMAPALRSALFAGFDPFNRDHPVVAQASSGTVTSLAVTLFGTRSTPGGGGSAIIAGADGVQKVYRVGSEVMPGVLLSGVAFDHVAFTRNGASELLYLDQSKNVPSAQSVVAANPVANPVAGAGGLSPPSAGASGGLTVDAARQGINFGPHAEGGKVVGLEVQPGADGSAFRAAGFQPGDIITNVNGKSVTGAGDSATLAAALRPGSAVSVTVRRGDQQLPLAITLAP
ncbi:type II secretion system protein N [Novosphingobium lentum]|uniref:type II secretion system protein N n=1 Tax=Novosphingobium lentum TaxID=145287 RepID=UPI00082B2730|nr:type II secretion system protein N [Novosphingobium lentum]